LLEVSEDGATHVSRVRYRLLAAASFCAVFRDYTSKSFESGLCHALNDPTFRRLKPLMPRTSPDPTSWLSGLMAHGGG